MEFLFARHAARRRALGGRRISRGSSHLGAALAPGPSVYKTVYKYRYKTGDF